MIHDRTVRLFIKQVMDDVLQVWCDRRTLSDVRRTSIQMPAWRFGPPKQKSVARGQTCNIWGNLGNAACRLRGKDGAAHPICMAKVD